MKFCSLPIFKAALFFIIETIYIHTLCLINISKSEFNDKAYQDPDAIEESDSDVISIRGIWYIYICIYILKNC